MQHPKSVMALIVIAISSACAAIPYMGDEFLPRFKEYDFLMHWVEKPGTSLQAMRRITVSVSKELRAIPGVRDSFGSHIGRAEVADEVVGPNFTELWISMDPKADYDKTLSTVTETVEGYPGLYRDVLTYLRERVKGSELTGSGGAIVVQVFGDDVQSFAVQAHAIADQIKDIEGVSNLEVEHQERVPQIQIELNAEKASQFGLDAHQIGKDISAMLRGLKVGEIYTGQRSYDVTLWGSPETQTDINALRKSPSAHLRGGCPSRRCGRCHHRTCAQHHQTRKCLTTH